MAAVAAGDVPLDDTFDDVIGFCLVCRACETACPSLVPFGRAMEGARVEAAAQLDGIGRKARHLVVGRLIRSRSLLRAATTAAALGQRLGLGSLPGPARRLRSLRRLDPAGRSTLGRVWEPRGSPVATVALLAGCVMDPWFPAVHEATGQVLAAAGYRVEVPYGQTCCGALAAHDGAARAAEDMAAKNIAAFAGFDLVVADAAGCGAHLEAYEHWAGDGAHFAARVRDVTELVAGAIDEGRLPRLPRTGIRVGMQDPCHLRHAQRVVAEPRTVVAAAGHHPVEIDPAAMCCGAAGLYTLTHAETADELGRRKATEVDAAGVDVVASANPGCEMQLRAHLPASVRIAHPVELYAEALAAR